MASSSYAGYVASSNFSILKSNKSKTAKVVFYIICIINPYVEWTGYVANAGFMIVELFKQWKDNRWKAICLSEFIGFLTIISFGIFVLHYCTVIDTNLFFEALKNRFFARNFRVSQPISELLLGYIDSFKYAWIVLMVLFIVTILIYKNLSCIKQTVLWKNKYLYALFVFPVLENFIMKEHAISYSYDRMKFGFIIVLIICDLMSLILNKLEGKRLRYIAIVGLVLLDTCNLNSYMHDKTYTWNALFRESNEILARELEKYSDDSVMGYPYSVRGYLNILCNKGIYEWTNIDCIENIAKQSNRQYAIMLVPNTESEGNGWDMLGLEGAVVSDLYNDKISYTKVENNKCIEINDTCIVTDLSDSNWNKGISIDGKTLLFNYSNVLLNVIMKSDKMICGNIEFNIQNVDYDKLWIRITVDKDVKVCKFPESIHIMCN